LAVTAAHWARLDAMHPTCPRCGEYVESGYPCDAATCREETSMTKFATIGSDGPRCVVWGLGDTEADARHDADRESFAASVNPTPRRPRPAPRKGPGLRVL
jgi:hypothetical protein